MVEYLLRKGASVNARFKGLYTPLYIATQNNFLGVVKLLLSYGASLEGFGFCLKSN